MDEITIALGRNRSDTNWTASYTTWTEFVQKLRKVRRTSETMAEYDAMSTAQRGVVKDGAAFVGGLVEGGRRKKENVQSRSLITLDVDHAGDDFLMDVDIWLGGTAYVVYSTHSHREGKAKYRLIVPTDRELSPDEYAAVSRKLAENIGMAYFDKTTFDIHRLMYLPSCSKDAEPVFIEEVGCPLDTDSVLSEYTDWRDVTSWPKHADETKDFAQHVGSLSDPREKNNKIISAFCKAYDIHLAIETFLPDKYVAVTDNRYTHIGATGAGGMRVYPDKLDATYEAWAFSEHESDPANMGHCLNSFDLVRVHKGFDNDDMLDFASKDREVKTILAEQRQADLAEFDDDYNSGEDYNDNGWQAKLELNSKTGEVKTNSRNTQLILTSTPFRGALAYDEFKNTEVVKAPLPWRERSRLDVPYEPWLGSDDKELRHYFSYNYDIKAANMIMDTFTHAVRKNRFHPIKDYLESQTWDGVKRLDTLFVDYLGSEDSDYVRAVTRKMFVAAIKRVYQPGCKFDEVLVIVGPQGCGKSTIISKMGRQWFSDSLKSFESKEAGEYLQNSWIFEFAELAHMKKAAVEEIKAFTSKTTDMYRMAYDRVVSEFPRKCIFFGTTNNFNFLKDDTGNRRFWPIAAVPGRQKLDVMKDLTEDMVGQLWAEAKRLFDKGESTVLTPELSLQAALVQEKHMEENPLLGVITEWLDRPIDNGYGIPDERTHTCTLEIWVDCLGKAKGDFDKYRAAPIRDILRSLPGWVYSGKLQRFDAFGPQKAFEKIPRIYS